MVQRLGRLTTKTNTFPILTLNTKYREILKPNNDFFLEFDYNAIEIRILLFLSGQEQPKEDIHLCNAKRLGITRDQAKQQIFSWLYGSSKVDSEKFDKIYRTKQIIESYFDGKFVKNYFGRKIESDDFHCLNHIIQSTAIDFVFKQMIKLNNFIKKENLKTEIGFSIHDAVYLDVFNDESSQYPVFYDLLCNSDFGYFPVNVALGKNFGNFNNLKLD